MKLKRTSRSRERALGAKEILPHAEKDSRRPPSELLTPEIKQKLLEIKQGYEGGMIGDRMPNYTGFLAAARLCWPELKDDLVIKNHFLGDARSRIPASITNLLNGDEGGDKTVLAYAGGLQQLSSLACIHPDLIKPEVQEVQYNLLLLLKSELRMERYAYALRLALILWLGAPKSQPQTAELIKENADDLIRFVKKSKAWFIGAMAKLVLPELALDIPTGEVEKLNQKNKTELAQLVQQPNYGDTRELDARLRDIFAVGVLAADEATLQPDGTVVYRYAQKQTKQEDLPERLLA